MSHETPPRPGKQFHVEQSESLNVFDYLFIVRHNGRPTTLVGISFSADWPGVDYVFCTAAAIMKVLRIWRKGRGKTGTNTGSKGQECPAVSEIKRINVV